MTTTSTIRTCANLPCYFQLGPSLGVRVHLCQAALMEIMWCMGVVRRGMFPWRDRCLVQRYWSSAFVAAPLAAATAAS